MEEERGVVRVRVKKYDGAPPLECRSFAVDPQITSLKVLQHILIRAFDLSGKQNFGISFLSRDQAGGEVYLALGSDSDLDQAFVSAAKPFLQLKMDLKAPEDSPVMEDWDIISPKDVLSSEQFFSDKTRSLASAALPFTQSLLSQVGGTLSRVQQVFSWSYREEVKPFKPPLSDAEFHWYLNGQGQLTRPEELRLRIYHGGVEPSLRKVVWRYLLNVYPDGLTGQERMDYMKKKTREYDQLKREWIGRVSPEDLDFIRGNVLKDVLRTDRAHSYYAGSEDSPHLTALTNLLTTFAITHPQISYCQGMSDIASPILAVMDNEAHAFICFCGIMKRLEGNFRPDGQLMSVKFQHLKLLLQYSDPEFYSYLVSRGADDLFFCYRWLLLELKREFVFDDALRMLEITWSSLPPDPPETEVELLGPPLEPERPLEPEQPLDLEQPLEPLEPQKTLNGSSMEDGLQRSEQRRRHMLRPSREESHAHFRTEEDKAPSQSENKSEPSQDSAARANTLPLPRKSSFGEFKYYSTQASDSDLARASDSDLARTSDLDQDLDQDQGEPQSGLRSRQSTVESEEELGEKTPLIRTPPDSASVSSPLSPPRVSSPLSPPRVSSPPLSPGRDALQSVCNHSNSTVSPSRPRSLLSSPILSFGRSAPGPSAPCARPPSLPPPQEFGKGNPFMLFLCLSVLLEHRDHIVKNGLDYNELAMHFDRLVRRHHLGRVLQRAKTLFAEYLQSEVWESEEGDEVGSDSPAAVPARPIYSPLNSPPLCSPRASPNSDRDTRNSAHTSPNSTPNSAHITQNSTHTSPNSTYNLATTIPSPVISPVLSPSAQVSLTST